MAEQLITTESIHRKHKASNIALVATVFLTALKLIVAATTGSISILSEAIHSGFDLLSSLVTFFVVRVSVRPADWDHPFGHGKIESLSALFEAFLLLVAGGYIIYEGIATILKPDHHVHYIGWGAIAVGISVVVNLFVYLQNRHVAHEEESIAIETNAFHFLTDFFTSVAVFVSLVVIYFTGWVFIDALVAIAIAFYVFWVGVAQIKKCLAELSDSTLPETELSQVKAVLQSHQEQFISFHDLRTRKAGPVRYVDLHLEVCSEQKVHEAHSTCDLIEDDLNKSFKDVNVNIHIEPCGNHGPQCAETCMFYKQLRKNL